MWFGKFGGYSGHAFTVYRLLAVTTGQVRFYRVQPDGNGGDGSEEGDRRH